MNPTRCLLVGLSFLFCGSPTLAQHREVASEASAPGLHGEAARLFTGYSTEARTEALAPEGELSDHVASERELLYVHDPSARLGVVNVVTGSATVIGTMDVVMTDIAFSADGELYGITFSDFYRIDATNGAVSLVGRHGIPDGNALVFATDGVLYAASSVTTDLYTVDPSTGVAAVAGAIGWSSAGDLAFLGDILYLSSTSNELIRIDLEDGVSASAVGSIGFSSVFGLAAAGDGVLYGISNTKVISVDPATGHGTLVSNYGGQGLGPSYGSSFRSEAVPPAPDLLVTEIRAPKSAAAGSQIEVSWTITNQGRAVAFGPWDDGIFVSADSSDFGDPQSWPNLATLGPGESINVTQTCAVPEVPPGSYWLAVCGDVLDDIEEGGGESNNCEHQSIAITEPQFPDLTLTNVSHPLTATEGEAIRIDWSGRNAGYAAISKLWLDGIYLTHDPSDLGELVRETAVFRSLSPGESFDAGLNLALPEGLTGDLWVAVCVDVDDSVDEGPFEANNCRFGPAPIRVIAEPPYPALHPFAVTVQDTAVVRQQLAVSWSLENVGYEPTNAPYWRDRVLLSGDQILDDEDITLGDALNPSMLFEGEGYTQSDILFDVDESAVPGDYFVIVEADYLNLVQEGPLEDENYAVSSKTVAVVRKDPILAVERVWIDPARGWTSHDVTVSWITTNVGDAPAFRTPYRGGFYLSTDDDLDSGDTLVANHLVQFGPIEPGESDTSFATVTLPDETVGSFFAFVDPDPDDVASVASFPASTPFEIQFTAPPDLVVRDGSVSTEPVIAGDPIELSWTVQNVGAGPTRARGWEDWIVLTPSPDLDPAEAVLSVPVRHSGILLPDSTYTVERSIVLRANLIGPHYLHVATDYGNDVLEFSVGEENNTQLLDPAPLQIQPPLPADLEVLSLDIPAEMLSGDPVPVSWTVRNNGPGRVKETRWSDVLYLSRDAAIDPSDLVLTSSARATVLDVDSTYTVTSTITVPFDSTGAYRVILLADAGRDVFEEGLEGSNQASQEVRVSQPPPADLDVEVLEPLAAASSGQDLPVRWTVRNLGDDRTRPNVWRDVVTLATTPDPAPEDVIAQSVQFRRDGLASQESYSVETTLRVPHGTSGTHFLLLECDTQSLVWEDGARSNNRRSVELPIALTPPPDLTVTRLLTTGTAVAGRPLTVEWQVENAGAGAVPAVGWKDGLYLSENRTFEARTDRPLARVDEVGPLAAHTAYARNFSVDIPAGWVGEQFLLLVTNEDRGVYEHGATSNNNAALAITIDSPPLEPPDLVPTDFALLSSGDSYRGSIGVRWAVENAGEFATPVGGSWIDRFYLSEDELLDPGDEPLAFAPQATPVSEGAGYERSIELGLPPGANGQRYVLLEVDVGNRISEEDEANNLRSLPVSVAPVQSDLRVVDVASDTLVYSGQTLSLSWAVENPGTDPTPAERWSDRVHLSTDPALDATDRYLGTVHRGTGLAGGESYVEAITVDIPLGLAGNFYVLVQTDVTGKVFELDETNNLGLSASRVRITIPPPADLTVAQIRIPSAGTAGDSVTVEWEVENASPVPVEGRWEDSVFLSADEVWDLDDPIIGTYTHVGGLAPRAAYDASVVVSRADVDAALAADLPGALPGSHHVLVRTDSRDQIHESDDRNNIGLSQAKLQVRVVDLRDGEERFELRDQLKHYYRYEHAAGAGIRVDIEFDQPMDFASLAIRAGQIPRVSDADYLVTIDGEPTLTMFIPDTPIGDYYMLLETSDPVDAVPMSIRVTSSKLAVLDWTPRTIGTTAPATIQISGEGFTPDDNVTLVLGGDRHQAIWTAWVDQSCIYATFDLPSDVAGAYDMKIEQSELHFYDSPDSVDTVDRVTDAVRERSAVQVDPMDRQEVAIDIQATNRVRVGTVFEFDIALRNPSNVDVVPPILVAYAAPASPISFDGTFEPESVVYLFPGARTPTGTLRPSETVVVRARVRAPNEAQQLFVNATPPQDVDIPFSVGLLLSRGGLSEESTDRAAVEEWFQVHAIDSWARLGDALASLVRTTYGTRDLTMDLTELFPLLVLEILGNTGPELPFASEWVPPIAFPGDDPFPCGWEPYPRGHCGDEPCDPFLRSILHQRLARKNADYGIVAPCAWKHLVKFLLGDSTAVVYEEGVQGQERCDGAYVAGTLKATTAAERFHEKVEAAIIDWASANPQSAVQGAMIPWHRIPGWDPDPFKGDHAGEVALRKWDYRRRFPFQILDWGDWAPWPPREDMLFAFGDIERGTGTVEIRAVEDMDEHLVCGASPGKHLWGVVKYEFCDYYRFNPHPETCIPEYLQRCWPETYANFHMTIRFEKRFHVIVPTEGSGSLFVSAEGDSASCDLPEEGEEVDVVRAIDPNEKRGPTAGNEPPYVVPTDPIPYTVLFENLPEATAPAQLVTIVDSLDVDLEPGSFRLGPMIVAGEVISEPPNQGFWQEEIELDSGLLLRIDAGVDVRNAVATWRFETIDPATGLPPEDPGLGFLPPNDDLGSGEGQVSYTVRARADAESGTEIQNRATIVFDGLESIETNVVTNFIETNLPDLVIKGVTTSTDGLGLIEGEPTDLRIVVGNAGTRPSGAVEVSLFDGHPDSAGVLLGTSEVSEGLAIGADAEVAISWTPTGSIGETSLYVLASGEGAIPDLSEEDNLRRVRPEVQPRTYELSLARGVNTVALPLGQEILPTASWMAERFGAELVVGVDSTGSFQSYFAASPGTNDFAVRGDAGYLLVADSDRAVVLEGVSHAGESRVRSGLNFLSLPLEPDEPLTARVWAQRLGARMVVRYDRASSSFFPFLPDQHEGEGFAIEGGTGYLVLADADRSVTYTGTGWFGQQESPLGAGRAVDLLTGAGRASGGLPVFGVTGLAWSDGAFGADDFGQRWTVQVSNRRSGAVARGEVDASTGGFGVAWVDLRNEELVAAGDVLEVVVLDEAGVPIGNVWTHTIDERDAAAHFVDIGDGAAVTRPVVTLARTNQPNPFRDATIIRYQLAQPGPVALAIYSVDGREVAKLVDEVQQPGFYTVRWDGRAKSGGRAGSGVYFVRFQTDDYEHTQKAVVLR